MYVQPVQVHATQFIKRLKGATQSVLTRCSDDGYYVVKFTNNPEGLIALLSEVITARLGRHLGLPIPLFEYIHVDDWLLQHSPGVLMCVDGIYTKYDAGVHFGSKTPCKADGAVEGLCFSASSRIARVDNLATFAGALVLDAWTGGANRREVVFARAGLALSYQPLFIDHHRSLNGWKYAARCPDNTPHYFRPEFYHFVEGWLSFEPWLTIAETTNHNTLQALVADIAPEWHVAKGFRSAIVTHLIRRQSLIRGQIEHLRDLSFSLFPNWHERLTLRSRPETEC
jgi:hypothetical protein